ncbi:MAG: hypothetical protein WCO57_04625 [Verrucomicrobiota bacterium]
MAKPSNPLEFPAPQSAWTGNRFLIPVIRSMAKIAKLWRPQGSTCAVDSATLSLVALRVVDRVTGIPYSADELEAKILASDKLTDVYDGLPANYLAPTAMAGVLTLDTNKTLTLTARATGVQSPAPRLTISAATVSATLAIVSETNGVVTVRPATDAESAITTTLAQLKTLLDSSTVLGGVLGVVTGTGATLIAAGTTILTGGRNVTLGTPAKLGRKAIEDGNEWTAMTEDLTTTQARWVKTYTKVS